MKYLQEPIEEDVGGAPTVFWREKNKAHNYCYIIKIIYIYILLWNKNKEEFMEDRNIVTEMNNQIKSLDLQVKNFF